MGDLAYQGSVTLGGCFPAALVAFGHLDLTVKIALPNLQASVGASASVTGPDLEATAAAVAAIGAALAVTPPGVAFEITAELKADLGTVLLAAEYALVLAALLGTAGVHFYSYTGRADDLGSALSAELTGGFPGGVGSDFTGAVIMAATAPNPQVALGVFCGVTLEAS